MSGYQQISDNNNHNPYAPQPPSYQQQAPQYAQPAQQAQPPQYAQPVPHQYSPNQQQYAAPPPQNQQQYAYQPNNNNYQPPNPNQVVIASNLDYNNPTPEMQRAKHIMNTGLFQCFEDGEAMMFCLVSWFFPGCLFGYNYCVSNQMEGAFGFCVGMCCYPCLCGVSRSYIQKLAAAQDDGCALNCLLHFFCAPCALAQESRVIEHLKRSQRTPTPGAMQMGGQQTYQTAQPNGYGQPQTYQQHPQHPQHPQQQQSGYQQPYVQPAYTPSAAYTPQPQHTTVTIQTQPQ